MTLAGLDTHPLTGQHRWSNTGGATSSGDDQQLSFDCVQIEI